MRYRVATVVFKGDHQKKYSFFVEDLCNAKNESIEAACCHIGDLCLCDTSTGLAVGEVVDTRSFEHRPKECYRFIMWWMPPSHKEFLCGKYHKNNIKKLIEEEQKGGEEEDDLDFLKDL